MSHKKKKKKLTDHLGVILCGIHNNDVFTRDTWQSTLVRTRRSEPGFSYRRYSMKMIRQENPAYKTKQQRLRKNKGGWFFCS